MDEDVMNQFMDFESTNRKMESFNKKRTCIHVMSPFVKIIITVLYIGLILSYSPYDLDGLILFLALEVFVVILSEISIRELLKRVVFTLPFILLIGVSNLILDRTSILTVAGIVITKGMISCITILLKSSMSVSILYLLIATTETNRLMSGLRMLHMPNIFLTQLELMMRYVGVLVEETKSMYYAYRLRMPGVKGIIIRHMGEFLGQLLLKSMNRSERIYHAMKCRGYHGAISTNSRERLKGKDYLQLGIISILMIACRFIRVF